MHQVDSWTRHALDRINDHPRLFLAIICIASFAVFTSYSILRHLALWTGFFDLGLNANSIWKTLNGFDTWRSLLLPSTQGHINHISPILAPVALAYAAFPDPITLLVVQAAVVSLATVPLYYLSLRELQSKTLAFLVPGLFLVSPGLFGVVRFDFHVEAFLPLFIFLVYYSYRLQAPFLFLLSVALLLLTTEYSAVMGLGIALSLWFQEKKMSWRISMILGLSGVLLGVVVLSSLGSGTNIFGWPSDWLSRHYSGATSPVANGYVGSPLNLFANPVAFFSSIGHDLGFKLVYLAIVFAPFWQAPFKYFSRIIPAIPWIGILLVSSKPSFYSPYFQYSAFVLPFVLVTGLPLLKQLAISRKSLLSFSLLGLMVSVSFFAVTPFLTESSPVPSPDRTLAISMGQSVPLNATILTQTDLFPQISNRPFVTINYDPSRPPQYVLLDSNSSGFDWTSPLNGYPLSMRQETSQLFSLYQYKLLQSQLGVELYQLQSSSS